MRVYSVVALAWSVWLSGCAGRPGDHYDVIIDRNASDALVEATALAASDWEANVPVKLPVSIADSCKSGDHVICVHPTDQAWLNAEIQDPGFHPAAVTKRAHEDFTNPDGADVWILKTLVGADLDTALTHEIGHAQGLVHTGVTGDLMCGPYECDARQVTARDVEQWLSLR